MEDLRKVGCLECAGPESLCEGCHEALEVLFEGALAQAERERDEARAQAVWAAPISSGWIAWCPGGRVFGEAGWGDVYMAFPTEAEALAAGRALPWWEVEA